MTRKILLFAAAVCIATPAVAAPVTYTVDPTHTFARFSYHHLGLSYAQGQFDGVLGSVTLDRENKTGSADIVIDVGSVHTGVAALDEKMVSPEFFDAAKYPQISFKSTQFHFDGDTLKTVDGTLTAHGQSRPVTLTLSNFVCTQHPMRKAPVCAANASATIKRSDFGVAAFAPLVSDEVRLDIEIEALAGS